MIVLHNDGVSHITLNLFFSFLAVRRVELLLFHVDNKSVQCILLSSHYDHTFSMKQQHWKRYD